MNNTRTDTTNVYRYKVTKRGRWLQDHLGGRIKKGDPYEEIEFRGYCQNCMQFWEPWHKANEYMIVEFQKLEAFSRPDEQGHEYFGLEWQTIRTKTFGEE